MDSINETKPQVNEDNTTSVGSFVWELVKILLVAVCIIVPVRMFVAEPFIVSGSSMVPNFHDREYLIINKLGYHIGDPGRGDVIVLKYPKNPREYFIKRIVGIPGDTIKFQKGSIFIYNAEYPEGKELKEDYLPNGVITYAGPESTTLQAGQYFVLGDNRGASSDSRMWGVLEDKFIVGKAMVRILPLSKFSIFSYSSPLPNK